MCRATRLAESCLVAHAALLQKVAQSYADTGQTERGKPYTDPVPEGTQSYDSIQRYAGQISMEVDQP